MEQPLHRDVALEHDLREWKDRLPLIIDESEGALENLPKTLELGYSGTSHKNCKGIVKGLANAALLDVRMEETGQSFYLTAEDLADVGPVTEQDLAMVALLGITHAERNGHHYFRGLSMFPEDLWTDLTQTGLYHRPKNFPLHIQDGSLNLEASTKPPSARNIYSSLLGSLQLLTGKLFRLPEMGNITHHWGKLPISMWVLLWGNLDPNSNIAKLL